MERIKRIWYTLWCLLLVFYDKNPMYKTNYNEFEFYMYYKLNYLMNNFHIKWDHYGNYTLEHNKFDEPTKLIRNWKELKECNLDNGKVMVKVYDDYENGAIIRKNNGKRLWYLTTHSFYGNNYKETTNLLRCYGFNVELANWDKEEN